jgi:hypothetical protein
MNQNIEDIAFQQAKPVNVTAHEAKQNYSPSNSYLHSDNVYYAVASDIAYKHRENIKKDPKTADVKTDKLIKSRMADHNLMAAYSNENQVAIRRPDDSIIFAVRGTDKKNPLDLYNDALILTGTTHLAPMSRYTEVEKVFKTLPKDKEVTLTGHSLGADVARRIGEKYGKRSVTFSTPAVYGSLPGQSQNTTYLTNNFDWVSSGNIAFNFRDSLQILPQTASKQLLTGSHEISNFLPPKSMYPLRHHMKPYRGLERNGLERNGLERNIEFSKPVIPIKELTRKLDNPFIPVGVYNDSVKKRKLKYNLKDKDGLD